MDVEELVDVIHIEINLQLGKVSAVSTWPQMLFSQ